MSKISEREIVEWVGDVAGDIIEEADRDQVLAADQYYDIDGVEQAIHESVDGTSWLIYYHYQLPLLEVLEDMVNLDDIADNIGGSDLFSGGFRNGIAILGFYGLEELVTSGVQALVMELQEEEED